MFLVFVSCVGTLKDRSFESEPPAEIQGGTSANSESSEPPQVNPSSLSEVFSTGRFALDSEGLLVMGVWLRGSDQGIFRQGQGCRLRLRERTSGIEKVLSLNEPLTIEPLNPGVWDVKRLGCGIGKVWELEGLFQSGLLIQKGEISVAGWMVLELNPSQALVVREAGREFNTELALRLKAEHGQSPLISVPLVSAFTKKALPKGMTARDEVVRIQAKSIHLKTATAKAPEQAELADLLRMTQECATEGLRKDPLRAGQIELESEYRSGVSVGVKPIRAEGGDTHAMRDELELCFIRALSDFKSPNGGDFQLKLIY